MVEIHPLDDGTKAIAWEEASVQDFVSTRWIRLVGLVASMALLWAIFVPYRFPWMGLAWVTLAFSAALWLRARSPRSIAQVIDDIEAEPVRAVDAPGPVGVTVADSRAQVERDRAREADGEEVLILHEGEWSRRPASGELG